MTDQVEFTHNPHLMHLDGIANVFSMLQVIPQKVPVMANWKRTNTMYDALQSIRKYGWEGHACCPCIKSVKELQVCSHAHSVLKDRKPHPPLMFSCDIEFILIIITTIIIISFCFACLSLSRCTRLMGSSANRRLPQP